MTPKTIREHIISLHGHVTGLKKDINMVMLGLFNPEDYKNLIKQDKSGLNKAIDQINKELGTFYKITDFINPKELASIKSKYTAIPLGLSEEDRQKYLEMPSDKRKELIIQPAGKEIQELRKKQKIQDMERLKNLQEERKAWEENRKSNLPASPFIPDVDATVTASLAPVVDQTTGLTRTESALLSPSEKVIAQRSNQGIMGLV